MRKPKKPVLAIVDGDLLAYPAAASAQKTIYVAKDVSGETVAEFESAKGYKNWVETIEAMDGMDMDHNYTGNLEDLTRESYVRVGDLKTAKSNFKSMLNDWLKRAGVDECEVYLSPKQGMRNFRHDIALRKVYKGQRAGDKPVHLEELRKWAFTLPYVKRARSAGYETDDVCCAKAQKLGEKGVLVQNEKDGQQVVGCWLFYPDIHETPIWSDPNTVGWLKEEGKNVVGCGWLWLLHQVLTGDAADCYSGLDGCGKKTSYKLLSECNNMPIESLPDVVRGVIGLYRVKYGDEWKYVDKDGVEAVGSWYDFFEESVRLAYMVKNRKDYPHLIMDVAKEELQNDSNT